MSESDLYRKQRVAIQEVAKTLATMEELTVPLVAAKEEDGRDGAGVS